MFRTVNVPTPVASPFLKIIDKDIVPAIIEGLKEYDLTIEPEVLYRYMGLRVPKRVSTPSKTSADAGEVVNPCVHVFGKTAQHNPGGTCDKESLPDGDLCKTHQALADRKLNKSTVLSPGKKTAPAPRTSINTNLFKNKK